MSAAFFKIERVHSLKTIFNYWSYKFISIQLAFYTFRNVFGRHVWYAYKSLLLIIQFNIMTFDRVVSSRNLHRFYSLEAFYKNWSLKAVLHSWLVRCSVIFTKVHCLHSKSFSILDRRNWFYIANKLTISEQFGRHAWHSYKCLLLTIPFKNMTFEKSEARQPLLSQRIFYPLILKIISLLLTI